MFWNFYIVFNWVNSYIGVLRDSTVMYIIFLSLKSKDHICGKFQQGGDNYGFSHFIFSLKNIKPYPEIYKGSELTRDNLLLG